MLIIIHGDDVVASQNKLSELIKTQKNVTVLDCEKIKKSEIEAGFASFDMFVQEKCIVMRKFLKLKKADSDALLCLIEHKGQETTVILWHNTELSKAALSKFKQAQVHVYLLPKLFFAFLDNLSPKSTKQELKTLSEMEGVEAEQIFYAMVKRVRQLFYIRQNIQSEEVVKISPWQMGKLSAQAALWDIRKLENLLEKFLQIEIKMKSGGLVLPLKKELDRVLIQELH